MSTSRIAIVLGSALAVAALACSSADPQSPVPVAKNDKTQPDPNKDKPGGNTQTGGNTENENETPGNTTPTPTGDGAACLAKADADGCFKCCEDLDPKAFDEAMAASDSCFCGATGVCKTQCASSICKSPDAEVDAQCGACLDSQPAAKCDDAFMTACNAKASCKAALACEKSCIQKFPEQGGPSGGG